ncbi:MAG: hypothetical protein HYX89_00575 [Chloroflexi bacterium]|nr:hypothetical protein [Chloroflexota bacterium]
MRAEIEERTKYFIDQRWYEENNRDFVTAAQRRFCPRCRAKIGAPTEERVPRFDAQAGRVVFETKAVPYGSNPLAVIRDCCSKERFYIDEETPLLEAIFRVFLAYGNQPIDVEAIREQLGQYLSLHSRAHGYSPQLLEHLIMADDTYGIRPFSLEAPAEGEEREQ